MSPDFTTDGFITEPLAKHHDRAAFSCGASELDQYLREQARQDARRNVAAPFVLCQRGRRQVIGFYTLSATSADLGELPAEIARKLPHYPEVPAFLLGRLAVHGEHAGSGLGKRLLVDALRRCWEQSARIAAALVIVDARDEQAAMFYQHFGFQRFFDRRERLFLPMHTVADLFR